MKSASRSVGSVVCPVSLRAVSLLLALLAGGAIVGAAEAGPGTAAKPKAGVDVHALWADVPAYVAALDDPRKIKDWPKLTARSQPSMPPVHLEPGHDVTVLVGYVIGEDGGVEAARVARSDDERFNDAALAAVKTWRFTPPRYADGPAKAFGEVPIVFGAPPPAMPHLGIQVGPLQRVVSSGVRLGDGPPPSPDVTFTIGLSDAGASDVKAMRVLVTAAEDDTGATLKAQTSPDYFRPSVGRTTDEELRRRLPPYASITLSAPADGATAVRSLTGVLELVIPALDPNSTVRIARLASHYGRPLDHPSLQLAHVTIVAYDQATAEQLAAAGGPEAPAQYDTGRAFGPPPKGMPADMGTPYRMGTGSVALGIDDPEQRLVDVEFETADGGVLTYNHNGNYHSSGMPDHPGRRFSIYEIPGGLPADAQLVCWLRTDKSLVKIPLNLANMPLPKPPAPATPTPAKSE